MGGYSLLFLLLFLLLSLLLSLIHGALGGGGAGGGSESLEGMMVGTIGRGLEFWSGMPKGHANGWERGPWMRLGEGWERGPVDRDAFDHYFTII